MGSPLWKRRARGDFIGSFDSIGVISFYIVPLYPAYLAGAGLAGHVPVNDDGEPLYFGCR
jgi:hypothetical protein